MSPFVRLAKPQEINEIIDLQTLSLSVLSAKSYSEKQLQSIIKSQEKIRRRINQQNLEIIFVAIADDGNIVGFATLSTLEASIEGVYVHPDFIRQGIGSRLIQELEKIALMTSRKRLYVQSSLGAVNFYQRNGYVVLRKCHLLLDQMWIPCQLLKKDLIPPTRIEYLKDHFASIAAWAVVVLLIVRIILLKA